MEKELFSVVIVAYNQKQFIYECIDSILEQEYPKIELIIADDHSYDFDRNELIEYIQENKKENILTYNVFTNDENIGIVRNCNKGARLAQGTYLKTIAADDMLHDKNVLLRMEKLLHDPENGIVCARGKAIQANGKPTDDIYPSDIDFAALANMPNMELYRYMVTRPWSSVFAPGVFWRADQFCSMGGYDEKYHFTEDWPCWIRLAKENVPFCFADDITVYYRYGGISNASLDGLPNPLRRVHYQECVQMLRQEQETVRNRFGKGAAVRCWYCAEAIEMKSVLELDWFEMSFGQKLRYRIHKLPVLCYIKLLSAINYNKWFHFKKELLVITVLMWLLIAEKQLIPGHNMETFTACLILVLIALIGIKVIGNLLLYLLKKRAMVKTMLSGR